MVQQTFKQKKDNDWCITIPIDLNVIQFERNGFKIVVKKVQSFITSNEQIKAVGLTKTVIYVLIYDEREKNSISTQDSLDLLRNFDSVDFAL